MIHDYDYVMIHNTTMEHFSESLFFVAVGNSRVTSITLEYKGQFLKF